MAKLHILNGPEIGRSFELRDVATYVGRSADNDVQIHDKTVSRKHLKIVKRGNKYLITDLNSRNKTFFNGNYLAPGIELEVREGVPIAIGMSVICLGERFIKQMMPLLDSIGLTRETDEQSGIFLVHGHGANQKKLELLYKVSELLREDRPINETLEKILDCIFDLLRRIERAAFIMVDPETENVLDVISRTNTPGANTNTSYCGDVVRRVIEEGRPLVISDVQTEEEHELLDTLKILKIESVLCVPLISNSQILGAIYIDSQERPFGFTDEDLALFMDLCQRTALAMEHARLTFDLTTIADSLPADT
jgi:putative methionine-R-sulfoxide reductase with GAF domain